MNVSGLCLNKILIEKLLPSIDDIPDFDLKGGLRVFNSYEWGGFSLPEFKHLMELFSYLTGLGCFKAVPDDHLFVFNYSTDVTEMDIASVLKINEKRVFIDVEAKNGDDPDLAKKIKKQLDKRQRIHMPQLLKNQHCLIIGFTNNVFEDARFFDADAKKWRTLSEEEMREMLEESTGDPSVEEILVQSSSLASIVKVCQDIRNGDYSYYDETVTLSEELTRSLDERDCAIVYGNAGTGKSVLALKLFFENPSSKMLVLNSKLFFATGMKKEFSQGRATFNSGIFLSGIDKDTISIVDECQRLSLETIAEIIKKSKFTFLFGDNKQTFNKNGFLGNARKLAKSLKDSIGANCFVRTISKSRRYSNDVSKALDELTSVRESKKEPKVKRLKDYSIKVLLSEERFLSEYKNAEGIKKIYVPIPDARGDLLTIGGDAFIKADYTDDDFSIWPSETGCFGITYHALSFDVDHSFVFLKNLKMTTYDGKRVFYTSAKPEPSHFDDIQIYLNELNVLFTRGRKSLTVYVQDIEAYLHLQTMVGRLQQE